MIGPSSMGEFLKDGVRSGGLDGPHSVRQIMTNYASNVRAMRPNETAGKLAASLYEMGGGLSGGDGLGSGPAYMAIVEALKANRKHIEVAHIPPHEL